MKLYAVITGSKSKNVFLQFFLFFLLLNGCTTKNRLKGRWQVIQTVSGGFTQNDEVGESGDFLTFKDSTGYYTMEINNNRLRKKMGKNLIPENDTIIIEDSFKYSYVDGLLVEKRETKYGLAKKKFNVKFENDKLFLNCLNCTVSLDMILIKHK